MEDEAAFPGCGAAAAAGASFFGSAATSANLRESFDFSSSGFRTSAGPVAFGSRFSCHLRCSWLAHSFSRARVDSLTLLPTLVRLAATHAIVTLRMQRREPRRQPSRSATKSRTNSTCQGQSRLVFTCHARDLVVQPRAHRIRHFRIGAKLSAIYSWDACKSSSIDFLGSSGMTLLIRRQINVPAEKFLSR